MNTIKDIIKKNKLFVLKASSTALYLVFAIDLNDNFI